MQWSTRLRDYETTRLFEAPDVVRGLSNSSVSE